jgi:hypothetical protein
MTDNFDEILDECIDRISRGETAETCLADYPEYKERLEPLLAALASTHRAYEFTPADEAMRRGRQKLYEAMEKRRKTSFWHQMSGRRLAWTGVIVLAVVLLGGYLGLKTLLFAPESLPGDITQATPGLTTEPAIQETPLLAAVADPEGNFIFLVSDEVNAIGDFSSLNVNVEKIQILPAGNKGKGVEILPEVSEFDLTLLPGEKTQEIWRGNVPDGEYEKVVVYAGKVSGVLEKSGELLEIKLPSNKLQISLPFKVEQGSVTSFVYDLTVIKTGNGKNGGKYILKPQAGESGATQRPVQKYEPEKGNKHNPSADRLTP